MAMQSGACPCTHKNMSLLLSLVSGATLLVILPTMAQASDKLMVEYPRVAAGETEIGIRSQIIQDADPELNHAQTWKLGAGHGFNDYWFSELYAEYEKDPAESGYKAEFIEWENLFRLSEPGRYWADYAIIVEYSHAIAAGKDNAYKLMPIVQKRFSTQMLTMNFGFERNKSENGTSKIQFSYGWQYRWLGNPALDFALEGYGQLGDVGSWSPPSEQIHQVGPALVGKIKTSPGAGWEYRVGLFFGLNELSPNKSLLASIEYEFN